MRNNIEIEASALAIQMHSSGVPFTAAMDRFEQSYLEVVLRANAFNQCKAADEMGIHRNTIGRMLLKRRGKLIWTLKRGALNPPVPIDLSAQYAIESATHRTPPKPVRDVFYEVTA